MSATQVSARRAIYQRFLDTWDSALATPSVDGEPFIPPEQAAWVRLAVRNQASRLRSFGEPARRWERFGSIFVQIFTPRDQGTEPVDVIGEAVREMFEGKEIDGVHCYATSVRESGVDGSWFLAVAETAFDFDEQR